MELERKLWALPEFAPLDPSKNDTRAGSRKHSNLPGKAGDVGPRDLVRKQQMSMLTRRNL
jgi:hypothetical protein